MRVPKFLRGDEELEAMYRDLREHFPDYAGGALTRWQRFTLAIRSRLRREQTADDAPSSKMS